MDEVRQITVTRVVNAPVERVFALLADPDRHPDIDGSDMLRSADTHTVLTGIGEIFTMNMHLDGRDYQTDNLITTYVRDQAIGWATGPAGERPRGHTFTYHLAPESNDSTSVTQIYDWSQVGEAHLPRFPRISREELSATLDRMAEKL